MLLFSDMPAVPKAQIIRAMEKCHINPKDYDTTGNAMIQIICMQISGKPITMQFNSINGILNLSMVLLQLLKEIKGEDSTSKDWDSGSADTDVLNRFMHASAN